MSDRIQPEGAHTNDLTLLNLHIETLFVCDGAGQLCSVNDRHGDLEPPLVFVGQAGQDTVYRFRYDCLPAVRKELTRIIARHSKGPSDMRGELTSGLRASVEQLGLSIRQVWAGPAFCCGSTLPTSGRVIAVKAARQEILWPCFPQLAEEIDSIQPCVAALIEDTAVAVCHTARRSERAAEAGVFTVEGHRRNGYGTAVVAEWRRLVERIGLIAMFSTSWDNHASRGLAHTLCMRQYASDFHITVSG